MYCLRIKNSVIRHTKLSQRLEIKVLCKNIRKTQAKKKLHITFQNSYICLIEQLLYL